jgi:hypothetical protein
MVHASDSLAALPAGAVMRGLPEPQGAVLRPWGSGEPFQVLQAGALKMAPDLGELPGGRGWDRTSGLCCVSAEPGVPLTCGDLRFRS